MTNFISCPEAKNLIESGAQLVDVRSPMEYQQFNLPKAKNIPVQQINLAAEELDPEKPVVVYCASGGRSAMAQMLLQQMGFNQVYNLGSAQNYLSC